MSAGNAARQKSNAMQGRSPEETSFEMPSQDEPSNRLALQSVRALDALSASCQGALVVISHDKVPIRRLRLTRHLPITSDGWQLDDQCLPPHDRRRPDGTPPAGCSRRPSRRSFQIASMAVRPLDKGTVKLSIRLRPALYGTRLGPSRWHKPAVRASTRQTTQTPGPRAATHPAAEWCPE